MCNKSRVVFIQFTTCAQQGLIILQGLILFGNTLVKFLNGSFSKILRMKCLPIVRYQLAF